MPCHKKRKRRTVRPILNALLFSLVSFLLLSLDSSDFVMGISNSSNVTRPIFYGKAAYVTSPARQQTPFLLYAFIPVCFVFFIVFQRLITKK